jgi:hypothetical protein
MDSSALDAALSNLEAQISSIEAAVDGLEKWLWIASVAVVVGVACELYFVIHEYQEDKADWAKGIIRAPDRPKRSILFAELASVLLVVLGVFGELGVGILSSNANSRLRSKNNERVSLVKQKVRIAESDARAANERAIQLALDLESEKQKTAREQQKTTLAQLALKRELDAGEAKQQPRRVSEEERTCMFKALIGMRNQPVAFEYWPTVEAQHFAEDFGRVFGASGAGLKITQFTRHDNPSHPPSLIFVSGSGTKDFGDAITSALQCSKYGPPGGRVDLGVDNSVTIFIDADPSRRNVK